MALHQTNMWSVWNRPNSSLDKTDAHGGLTAGCITLPEGYRAAKGFRVYITSDPYAPEDYASLNAMLTAIGGTMVTGLSHKTAIIEFDTTNSTTGTRGIFRVDALEVRPFHYQDPLTKGEAMRFMMPHGIDEYNWDGAQAVRAAASTQLLSLDAYSTDITQGSTTIQNGNLVVLPAAPTTRGVIITAIISGTFEGNGPHDMRVQLQDADGTTVIQEVPSYCLVNEVKKLAFTFPEFTQGIHDDLSTTGCKLAFINDSQSTVTIKAVRLLVQSISNPDFTLA